MDFFSCRFINRPFFLLLPGAGEIDLSSMTDDEIVELTDLVSKELVSRGNEKSAALPAGKYTGGKDLPAGAYIITCKTDDNHHGRAPP